MMRSRCDKVGVRNNKAYGFCSGSDSQVVLGGIYFSFTPIDVAPRKCPNCGGKTRYHDPFVMCDACEMLVGVNIEAIWRDLRLARRSSTGRN